MKLPSIGRKPRPQSDGRSEPPSVVGSGLVCRADLHTAGALHVHGLVSGDVIAETIVLERGGRIEGTVVAQHAYIHGRLDGRLLAPMVFIGPTAAVQGTIFHHKLSVTSGAIVDGRMPWRPMHYFEDRMQSGLGGRHEHVHEDRQGA